MLDDTSPSGTCDLQKRRRIMPDSGPRTVPATGPWGLHFSPGRLVVKVVRRTPCIGHALSRQRTPSVYALSAPEQGMVRQDALCGCAS